MNRYLMDRASRRGMSMRGRDGRNPYGSRGGYVTSRRRGRDMANMNYDNYRGGDNRMRDREMDMEYDYAKYDSRYDSRYNSDRRSQDEHYPYQQYGERNRPMEYEMYGYGIGGIRPMDYGYDYARGNRMRDRNYDYDYGYDYGYDYDSEEKEYEKELHTWIEKLKKKDRFDLSKDMVIQKAREMGVKFDEINEEEYYAIYLAMVSDYPQISNDPHLYLAMAKDFIFDDDIAVSPSEKVCIYLYEIVLGKD